MGAPIFNPEANVLTAVFVLATSFIGAGVVIQLGLEALVTAFHTGNGLGWGKAALTGALIGACAIVGHAAWTALVWVLG